MHGHMSLFLSVTSIKTTIRIITDSTGLWFFDTKNLPMGSPPVRMPFTGEVG